VTPHHPAVAVAISFFFRAQKQHPYPSVSNDASVFPSSPSEWVPKTCGSVRTLLDVAPLHLHLFSEIDEIVGVHIFLSFGFSWEFQDFCPSKVGSSSKGLRRF
jgi:hypothetical protein